MEFAAASSLLTILPGLDTALIIRTAAVDGPRSARIAGLGICTGVLFWGLLASTSLGVLFAASRLAYDTVRIGGAGYLLYVGIRLFLHRPATGAARLTTGAGCGASSVRTFRRGLFTNLLNPKVGLFYVSFLPQFVPAGAPVALFSVGLASLHAAESFLWFLALSGAASVATRWLAGSSVQRMINRITGAVFVAIGVKLVLSRR